jgi:hypothetical protein
MRRLGVIVALGALLGMFGGVVTASPAFARGHKWQLVQNVPITLPAALCGFKVRGVPTVNKEFAKVLKASDGSMTFVITGSFKASFTNLSTGKTITGNLSGPGKVTVHADGSITAATHGHSIVFLVPADAKRFGLPGVSVTTGALRFSEAANGAVTSLSLRGHVLVNVCAALS